MHTLDASFFVILLCKGNLKILFEISLVIGKSNLLLPSFIPTGEECNGMYPMYAFISFFNKNFLNLSHTE